MEESCQLTELHLQLVEVGGIQPHASGYRISDNIEGISQRAQLYNTQCAATTRGSRLPVGRPIVCWLVPAFRTDFPAWTESVHHRTQLRSRREPRLARTVADPKFA